jgi:hypothetical protein
MLAMWTPTIMSAWSDDGHLHATRYNEAVSTAGREAADWRRGIGGGGFGSAGRTGARSQRQYVLQLVPVVSGGATGAPERNQTVAGPNCSGEFHGVARRPAAMQRFRLPAQTARILDGLELDNAQVLIATPPVPAFSETGCVCACRSIARPACPRGYRRSFWESLPPQRHRLLCDPDRAARDS